MKKVALVYGGNSSEHDVSCSSAKEIRENIDKKNMNYLVYMLHEIMNGLMKIN